MATGELSMCGESVTRVLYSRLRYTMYEHSVPYGNGSATIWKKLLSTTVECNYQILAERVIAAGVQLLGSNCVT